MELQYLQPVILSIAYKRLDLEKIKAVISTCEIIEVEPFISTHNASLDIRLEECFREICELMEGIRVKMT